MPLPLRRFTLTLLMPLFDTPAIRHAAITRQMRCWRRDAMPLTLLRDAAITRRHIAPPCLFDIIISLRHAYATILPAAAERRCRCAADA